MPAVSIAPAETSPPGGGGSGSPSPPGPPGRAGIKRQHTCWSSGQQLAAAGSKSKGVTIMSRSPSVEESGEGEGEEEPKRASMSAAGLAMVFLRRSRRRNSDSKNEDEEMSTHAPMGHKESPIAPIGPEFGPRGVDRWVIHPNNGFKSFFDLIVVFAVLYTSFTLPMKLSFRLNFATELDAFIDVLFILDVILQFFHGYTHQASRRPPPRRRPPAAPARRSLCSPADARRSTPRRRGTRCSTCAKWRCATSSRGSSSTSSPRCRSSSSD